MAEYRMSCGPFIVETVGGNAFLCRYRAWLPDAPEKLYEFKSAREMGNWFEALCASVTASSPDPK